MSMPEAISLDKPLAIIADEDIVLGFSALGFNTYSVKDREEFSLALEEVLRQGSAVCLVQDNLYRAFKDQINNFRQMPLPVFIPFSKTKEKDLLDGIIKDIRIRATGAL